MSALPSAAEKKKKKATKTCIAVETLSSSVVFSALWSGWAFLNSVTFIDSYKNELRKMENLKHILSEFPFRTKDRIILQEC